jgi:hypothetical protein
MAHTGVTTFYPRMCGYRGYFAAIDVVLINNKFKKQG